MWLTETNDSNAESAEQDLTAKMYRLILLADLVLHTYQIDAWSRTAWSGLTLVHTITALNDLEKMAFENIVGKGEKCW